MMMVLLDVGLIVTLWLVGTMLVNNHIDYKLKQISESFEWFTDQYNEMQTDFTKRITEEREQRQKEIAHTWEKIDNISKSSVAITDRSMRNKQAIEKLENKTELNSHATSILEAQQRRSSQAFGNMAVELNQVKQDLKQSKIAKKKLEEIIKVVER